MKKKTPTKKSDAVKTGTETASANSGALSNLLNKLRPSSTAPMSKLIPIKCIEDDKFKMQDDSYMDIVQIVTKDLNSASESDLEALIAAWARMYRTNGFDIKLVSLNTPTDTRGQQHYIQKKIAQNKVPIYDYILREMETQLENVQETRTDRQYYILLFAESQDDYFYALSRISQTLIYNDLARKMSLPAKLAVLEKLNNKSQTIQVQNATKVNITYDLIHKRLHEIAERNDIDIEISKRELKGAIIDVMDGEYERLDVSKCAARLDTGNEPLVIIKAHGSVLEEATAKKNVVRKRTVKKKTDKGHDVGSERE